jgi:hypothetical protein
MSDVNGPEDFAGATRAAYAPDLATEEGIEVALEYHEQHPPTERKDARDDALR